MAVGRTGNSATLSQLVERMDRFLNLHAGGRGVGALLMAFMTMLCERPLPR